MADWSKPTTASTYSSMLTELKERDDNAAKLFDGTTDTSLPTGAIRWSTSNGRFEKWSGTVWNALASSYAINVTTFNGQPASYYTNASNLASGTLPAARFDDTSHGNRGGGSLHAVASTSTAGFMSAADKTKINGIESGATADMSGAEIVAAANAAGGINADLLGGTAPHKRMIDVQIFTASGTWTKPAGCIAAEVWCVGGGGPGGNVKGISQIPQALSGGGGSSGQGTYSYITSGLGATETIVVGAGGVAASTTNGQHGPGGDSSFGGHVVSKGGISGVNVFGSVAKFAIGQAGGSNNTSQVGQLKIAHMRGGPGSATAANWGTSDDWGMAVGGSGGDSPFGLGSGGVCIPMVDDIDGGGSYIAGQNGAGYGSGGSGAALVNDAAVERLGGSGAPGIVIVKSYA